MRDRLIAQLQDKPKKFPARPIQGMRDLIYVVTAEHWRRAVPHSCEGCVHALAILARGYLAVLVGNGSIHAVSPKKTKDAKTGKSVGGLRWETWKLPPEIEQEIRDFDFGRIDAEPYEVRITGEKLRQLQRGRHIGTDNRRRELIAMGLWTPVKLSPEELAARRQKIAKTRAQRISKPLTRPYFEV
jgi:hypothetical protein